jgi:uncharacterized membrane protein
MAMDAADLTPWIGVLEIGLGLTCLVYGLRARGRFGAGQAPIGVIFLMSAGLKLLGHRVPQPPLLIVSGIVFVAASVWFVRTGRADAMRRRELRKQRSVPTV